MATVNRRKVIRTHEGAPAKRINDEMALRRSVLACMLWENTFYEDGVDIAERIASLVKNVDVNKVYNLAIEARNDMKLRHAPLLIAREMARIDSHKKVVANLLENIIQRPDELTEFLAIYWKDGRQPLSAQVKKGLAKAFVKFDEYQYAKYYRRGGAVKLRDVMFLCHPKPKDGVRGYTRLARKEGKKPPTPGSELFKKIVDNTLEPPDTWEVNLSAGKDKKQTWERLIKERKLGALATLRNLRNMEKANVDRKLIKQAIEQINPKKILPYRFIAAAKYGSDYEPLLEKKLFECVEGMKFRGETVILVDVSASMDQALSLNSDMKRIDAACGTAMILREICEDVRIFTFSNDTVKVPLRRGFALRDAILNSQKMSGTYLGLAVKEINKLDYDTLVVFTDEQSHDRVPDPKNQGWIINVASYKNGVGYGKWNHIDGFSEAVIKFLIEFQKNFS